MIHRRSRKNLRVELSPVSRPKKVADFIVQPEVLISVIAIPARAQQSSFSRISASPLKNCRHSSTVIGVGAVKGFFAQSLRQQDNQSLEAVRSQKLH